MSAGKLIGFAVKQIGMTALSVVTQKAGIELGKAAVEKGTEQLQKHVLKQPEQPATPTEEVRKPIETGGLIGNVAANIIVDQANVLTEKFKKRAKPTNTQPEATANKTVNDIPDVSMTDKAEAIGGVVASKTEQTVSAAKQIGAGFIKGLKK